MMSQSPCRFRRSTVVFVLLIAFITAVAGPRPLAAAGASTHVGLRVWPTTAFEPANVMVMMIVERNPENRAMRIIVDSPGYFSSSEVQLDGERSPRVRAIVFRDLPAGDYEVRGQVLSDNGQVRGEARAAAIIAGR